MVTQQDCVSRHARGLFQAAAGSDDDPLRPSDLCWETGALAEWSRTSPRSYSAAAGRGGGEREGRSLTEVLPLAWPRRSLCCFFPPSLSSKSGT